MNSPFFSRASGKASRWLVFLAAGALTAVACGGSTSTAGGNASDTLPANIPDAPAESDATADAAEPSAEPELAADNLFAPVEVLEVNTEETFNFAETIGGGDKAVLLWFWAPH